VAKNEEILSTEIWFRSKATRGLALVIEGVNCIDIHLLSMWFGRLYCWDMERFAVVKNH